MSLFNFSNKILRGCGAFTARVIPGVIFVSGFFSAVGVSAQPPSVEDSRDSVQKWIQARKLISKENSDWIEDKAILEESVRVFEKESQSIEEDIEAARKESGQTRGEYQKLKAENLDIVNAMEKVESMVIAYEQQVRDLISRLPLALQDRLTPLTNRLPGSSEKSGVPVTARMQLLVGILGEIEKFQNSITVVNEIREVGEGESVEVETIYLGLAQAFYTDQEGIHAGRGVPGPDGWVWENQQGLGSTIRRVIDQYQEKATASFVPLPLSIRNQ